MNKAQFKVGELGGLDLTITQQNSGWNSNEQLRLFYRFQRRSGTEIDEFCGLFCENILCE